MKQEPIDASSGTEDVSDGRPRRLSTVLRGLAGTAADCVMMEEVRLALGDRSLAALLAFFAAINLLPLALLIFFSIRKFPAFLSIFLTTLFSGVLAMFTQHDLVVKFADDPGLSTPFALIKGMYAAMATGYVSNSGYDHPLIRLPHVLLVSYV